MVNEDYAVLGERIMAQALFRLAAPTAVPPRPKAPGRLILIDPPSRRREGENSRGLSTCRRRSLRRRRRMAQAARRGAATA